MGWIDSGIVLENKETNFFLLLDFFSNLFSGTIVSKNKKITKWIFILFLFSGTKE